MDYASTYNYGATTEQIWLIVITTVVGVLILDRLWNWTADYFADWLSRRRHLQRLMDGYYDEEDDADDSPGWFARLRERFRSHDIEDAADDPGVRVSDLPTGWIPPKRNVYLGNDLRLHPIDEAAQELEEQVRDA